MSFKLTFELVENLLLWDHRSNLFKDFYFKVFSSIMYVYCPNISTKKERSLFSHCSIQIIKQN